MFQDDDFQPLLGGGGGEARLREQLLAWDGSEPASLVAVLQELLLAFREHQRAKLAAAGPANPRLQFELSCLPSDDVQLLLVEPRDGEAAKVRDLRVLEAWLHACHAACPHMPPGANAAAPSVLHLLVLAAEAPPLPPSLHSASCPSSS